MCVYRDKIRASIECHLYRMYVHREIRGSIGCDLYRMCVCVCVCVYRDDGNMRGCVCIIICRSVSVLLSHISVQTHALVPSHMQKHKPWSALKYQCIQTTPKKKLSSSSYSSSSSFSSSSCSASSHTRRDVARAIITRTAGSTSRKPQT
jgi:hypothetical protein